MKNTFIFLMFIFFWIFSDAQTYTLKDICTNQTKVISTDFKEHANNSFYLRLLNNENKVLDSLVYEGLMWKGTIEFLTSSLIKIRLPLKGGLGSFYEKIIFIVSCKQQLVEGLNVISTELHEYHDMDKIEIKEEYEAQPIFITKNNKLVLKEKYKLLSNSQIDSSWENDCSFIYSDSLKIFYTHTLDLSNIRVRNKKINGNFFAILMQRYNYLFYNKKWYFWDENNRLYRD